MASKEAQTVEVNVDTASTKYNEISAFADPGVEKIPPSKALEGDDALEFLATHRGTQITAEEDRRILWKIDLFLMPLVSRAT